MNCLNEWQAARNTLFMKSNFVRALPIGQGSVRTVEQQELKLGGGLSSSGGSIVPPRDIGVSVYINTHR